MKEDQKLYYTEVVMCHCHSHGQCCSSSGGCGCQSKGCSCSCHKMEMSGGCQSSCGCGSKGCSCQSKQGTCDYAAKFLELADQAWMEVLKEKIKEDIKSNAKHMDQLAHLISEANHERWQKKMENKQCTGGFEEKLKEFFHMSCQNQCNK